MNKISSFLLILILGCLFLIGCDNKEDNNQNLSDELKSKSVNSSNQKDVPKDSTWHSSYSLETDKITIAIPDYTIEQSHKKLKSILDITDATDIKIITDAADFSSWEKVLPENEVKGEPYFYIIFNNGTMISMYSDIAYGGVKEYSEKDDLYTGTNYSGYYYMSKVFLTKIRQFVEP